MTRSWLAMLSIVVVLPAVGCARRPATTQAPAPSGVVMSPRAPAEWASRRAVASSAAPVATIARPAPQEFVAVPELQDIHFDFDRYDIRPDDATTPDPSPARLTSNATHLVLVEGDCEQRGTN